MGTHLAELVAVRAAGQCQAYVLEGREQTAGGPGRPDQALADTVGQSRASAGPRDLTAPPAFTKGLTSF